MELIWSEDKECFVTIAEMSEEEVELEWLNSELYIE